MSFALKLRFIEMAERHETIDFTMFNDKEETLLIYFANGTHWEISVHD